MRFLFALFFALTSLPTLCQSLSVPTGELVGFTEHLISFGHPREAISLAKAYHNTPLPVSTQDSLAFFMGFAYQKIGDDSLAGKAYLSVSEESPLYVRSRFLVVQSLISQLRFDSAHKLVASIPLTDSPETNEIKAFLESGTGYVTGKSVGGPPMAFTRRPELEAELSRLKKFGLQKIKARQRSAFTAGFLSALVPGLGKVYAGSNAQGLASFLRVGIFGGLALENYLRHGIKNPQFWFLSGIASVYYVGGIFGSVYLPKLNYREKIDAIHQDAKVGLLSPF